MTEVIDPGEVRFFTGSSHPQLAADIASYLGVPLDKTKITRFSNDNLYIQLGASVRSRKVFIVQSLHSPQVHGFFDVPADPLSSRPVFKHYFQKRDLSSTIVVAADMGHAKPAAHFAKDLGLPIAAGDKERVSDTKVYFSGIVGQQVRGCKRALIYDDEIATGGTIIELSRLLVEQDIQEIWLACTHGVFVRGGLGKLIAVPQITEIVTTNTVHIPSEKRHPKLHTLSVASVFGEAIRRNYLRQSIGDLFVFGE
jgi:ribose-phosphate pyrophosphokinase